MDKIKNELDKVKAIAQKDINDAYIKIEQLKIEIQYRKGQLDIIERIQDLMRVPC